MGKHKAHLHYYGKVVLENTLLLSQLQVLALPEKVLAHINKIISISIYMEKKIQNKKVFQKKKKSSRYSNLEHGFF